MKRNWMLMIVAATVASGAVLAQDLKATIPFDFTAGAKALSSGTYSVVRMSNLGGSYVLRMRNTQTSQGVILVSSFALNNAAQPTEGKLVFRCGSGQCALAQVHTPGASEGRAFPTVRRSGDKEHVVAVRLTPASPAKGF